MSDEMTQFLDGVTGAVEANSFEKSSLWLYNRDYVKRDWKDSGLGYLLTIGELAGMPVTLSVLIDEIDGYRILFYYSPSMVTDYRLVDKWLNDNLPKTAFRANGYINKTDAGNFHNIFPYVAVKNIPNLTDEQILQAIKAISRVTLRQWSRMTEDQIKTNDELLTALLAAQKERAEAKETVDA